MVHAQIGCEPKHQKSFQGRRCIGLLITLVLNHLHVSPNNIIVDNNFRIWLIDWELAGFYPQWFEHTAMCNSDWDILGRWERWVI